MRKMSDTYLEEVKSALIDVHQSLFTVSWA